LRRLIRTFARTGQDSDVWPVALVLFAVLMPTVCLLVHGRGDAQRRLAARQKLADAYRSQLSSLQARLERHWNRSAGELEARANNSGVSRVCPVCQSAFVDSVIILNEQGDILYPNSPSAPVNAFVPRSDEEGDKGRRTVKWNQDGRKPTGSNTCGRISSPQRAGAGRWPGSHQHQRRRPGMAGASEVSRAGRKNEDAIGLVSEF
jgi:hypothetical protein